VMSSIGSDFTWRAAFYPASMRRLHAVWIKIFETDILFFCATQGQTIKLSIFQCAGQGRNLNHSLVYLE
jgi:hypothetical protein